MMTATAAPRATIDQLHTAQTLADTGRYPELSAMLHDVPAAVIHASPTLTLYRGLSAVRLGNLLMGRQWTMIALRRARQAGDRLVEARALDLAGRVAIERGRLDEAEGYVSRAQALASTDGDYQTIGSCATTLAIVQQLRGRYEGAITHSMLALAAYQQAHDPLGCIEVHHHLAISHRERGELRLAHEAADRAVEAAGAHSDIRLRGQSLAGRAEIRVACNEPGMARREIEQAIRLHRSLPDPVREADDRRIEGLALQGLGQGADAETAHRTALALAERHGRPVLVAACQRDLSRLLERQGRADEARQARWTARHLFRSVGAQAEVQRLDQRVSNPG